MSRLLFICPDIQKPSGGIKQIYRQVDILNANGFESSVLHGERGFRCDWFKNDTQIVYNKTIFRDLKKINQNGEPSIFKKLKKSSKNIINIIKSLQKRGENVQIDKNDILVFPEIYGPKIAQIKPTIKKVIYNQGVYQTFFDYGLDLNNLTTPYLEKDIMGVVVNSNDALQYMKLAFPGLNVLRLKNGIDNSKFNFSINKKKQICFMPRRLRSDIVQVINILKFRGVIKNWEIKPIENMSEQEVANCMKESAIFLSFNINEGFGMPSAEAMACGCIVVGYPGQGGKEIFNKDFSYPVKDRDVKGFVNTLEKILLDYEKDSSLFEDKVLKASEFILKEYSLEEEKKSVISAWQHIINLT